MTAKMSDSVSRKNIKEVTEKMYIKEIGIIELNMLSH